MLISSIFAGNSDLERVAAGVRRIMAPETSDSVARIQQALIAVGLELATAGVDDNFGAETGVAVSAFKADRGISPSDPVVGPGTTKRLDLEVAYLDLNPSNAENLDAKALSLDPFFAGVLEVQLARPDIGQKVIDLFQLGDSFCFRASLLFDNFIARSLGRFIEPFIFDDYCVRRGPCTSDDFFDLAPGSTNYVDFLLARNPNANPVLVGSLHNQRRPDILSHRAPTEWWELKPMSVFSAIESWKKFNSIISNYAAAGLPYKPGQSYKPTPEILLKAFFTPEGENLDLILQLRHAAPGLVFWTLCVKGDYVAYFNRVRVAVGIAALLAALAEVLIPAAEAAGVVAAIREIAVGLGAASLPILTPR
jgi:hypothetical protein